MKNEGGSQIVDISVSLLKEPEGLRGMIMIVFTDVLPTNVVKTINPTERISSNSQREAELERELMQTPYRTLVDKIDGVVITFVNITASKVLEMELRETNLELEQRIVNQGEERVQVNDRLLNEVQQVPSEVAASKDLESKDSEV